MPMRCLYDRTVSVEHVFRQLRRAGVESAFAFDLTASVRILLVGELEFLDAVYVVVAL